MIDALAAADYAAVTVSNVHGLLSGLFPAAEGEGIIARNPARHLALSKNRPQLPATWTAAQVRHFLAATTTDDDYALSMCCC